jgi:hypothetical protein
MERQLLQMEEAEQRARAAALAKTPLDKLTKKQRQVGRAGGRLGRGRPGGGKGRSAGGGMGGRGAVLDPAH